MRTPRSHVMLMSVAMCFLLAYCVSGTARAAWNLESESLTPEEFASRFQSALKKDGQIIHSASIMTANVDGEENVLLEAESWVDLSRGLRRHEYDVVNEDLSVSGWVPPRQLIVINGEQVVASDGILRAAASGSITGNYENELRLCKEWAGCEDWYGTLFDSLMGLGPTVPESLGLHPRVESGVQYQGKNATALVHSWTYELGYEHGFLDSEEGTVEFKSSFYVEEDTFLPIAWVIDYQFVGIDRKGSFVATFDNEVVAGDTLPSYLFDPKSVLPTSKTVLQLADLGVDVYWLGDTYQAEGLPPLNLVAAGPAPSRNTDWRYVELAYSSPYRDNAVVVDSWRVADWRERDWLPEETEETTINGHRAFIHRLEGDAYVVDIYLPDSVVSIFTERRGGYNTRASVVAVVKALTLHQLASQAPATTPAPTVTVGLPTAGVGDDNPSPWLLTACVLALGGLVAAAVLTFSRRYSARRS